MINTEHKYKAWDELTFTYLHLSSEASGVSGAYIG
jgi:hypothetical protein